MDADPHVPTYDTAGDVDDALTAAKSRYDHADSPHDPDVLALIRAAEAMRDRLYPNVTPATYDNAAAVDGAIADAETLYQASAGWYGTKILALIRAAEAMRATLYGEYPAQLRDMVLEAETEDHDSQNRFATGYAMGLRVAAGLLGMPEGVDPKTRRLNDPDPMPVFVIKGKDQLAPAAVDAYHDLCIEYRLNGQAREVFAARREIQTWQERNIGRVKLPDHKHVPVTD